MRSDGDLVTIERSLGLKSERGISRQGNKGRSNEDGTFGARNNLNSTQTIRSSRNCSPTSRLSLCSTPKSQILKFERPSYLNRNPSNCTRNTARLSGLPKAKNDRIGSQNPAPSGMDPLLPLTFRWKFTNTHMLDTMGNIPGHFTTTYLKKVRCELCSCHHPMPLSSKTDRCIV